MCDGKGGRSACWRESGKGGIEVEEGRDEETRGGKRRGKGSTREERKLEHVKLEVADEIFHISTFLSFCGSSV